MRGLDSEKEQRILDSTSDIIMTQGIAAVSLSKIAQQAHIASGTLYTYFKDKDDMLRSLYLNRKTKLAQAITQFDVHGDPKTELGHFMDLVYQYGQTHFDDLMLIREFNQAPILNQLQISKTEAYSGFERLAIFVDHGVTTGAFVDINAQILMAYAYTPVVEYLIASKNQTIEAPFSQIKWLSERAVLK
ncbi:TetR/AcrR family transcriptional regulator [Levilactobacillus bambusae]|uniref:TetR/AcrR family transcriptional regulator n=1 Tax=Levilactobacillus bambusae TaxID=2024736 RepID=A0A2V1N2U7_9LACO|nr:TetR/AcrR family transcriptional regulator [Levilactobacillus bambusae]PWG00430.1 TetR/AcrR family transcriptional regulator [Levilactobacillus bambusae]